MAASEDQSLGPKLIKSLASCKASTRSKSLKSLLSWLPSQTEIPDDQMKKLWKSLFYCMWHCDKSENQINLINRLSSLLPSLSPQLSLSYFSHFLIAMTREWPGIDHLRLDKFYLLIRSFVRNLFVLMKKSSWDLGDLEGFVRVLERRLFFSEDAGDKGLGNGVCYHFVSVFFSEVKEFLPLRLGALNLLLRPFFDVLGRSDNKVLVGKVKGHVFDLLVKNGRGLLEVRKSGGEVDEREEVVLFGTIALGMGMSKRLFDLGSDSECLQGNRKVVFALHAEFEKLEKQREVLGVEVSFPEGDDGKDDDDDDDEVPQLIPVNGDGEKMDEDSKGKGESKKSKDKKSKKKKKKKGTANKSEDSGASAGDCNGDIEMVHSYDDSSNLRAEVIQDALELNDALMSNLQRQFEKIAAESGLDGDGASALESSPTVQVNLKAAKKRKRSKPAASLENGEKVGWRETTEEEVLKTEEKSVKRVRFSMKNNLIWKPHSPLPPQSVRIPPSVTPRGSALKKGLSPGPIRDSSQDIKRGKKKKPSPLKKARKVKSISPGAKRVKRKSVTRSA